MPITVLTSGLFLQELSSASTPQPTVTEKVERPRTSVTGVTKAKVRLLMTEHTTKATVKRVEGYIAAVPNREFSYVRGEYVRTYSLSRI